jgi:hypothetical protein
MKIQLFAFLTLLSLTINILAIEQIEPVVQVEQGWVRQMPPTMMMTAAYMHLKNLTDTPIIFLGGDSPDFDTVELHQTIVENGLAKMSPVENLTVAPQKTLALEPGGLHIMLIGKHHALQAGDKVTLTLHFDQDRKQTLSLEVKKSD